MSQPVCAKALFPAQRGAFRSLFLAELPGADIRNHRDIVRFAGYSALASDLGPRQSDSTKSRYAAWALPTTNSRGAVAEPRSDSGM